MHCKTSIKGILYNATDVGQQIPTGWNGENAIKL